MRRLILVGLFLLLFASALRGQTAQPGMRFTFDYMVADLATYGVTRFELQVDAGAFVSIGLPAGVTLADTPAGALTYTAAIPALVQGPHTFNVRPCNDVTCGPATTPYAFTFEVVPPPVRNLRLSPGGVK